MNSQLIENSIEVKILKLCNTTTTGCLVWNGHVRKGDGTALLKYKRKQIYVRLTLFNIRFPGFKAKRVYGNTCKNPKCVAPEHTIRKKPVKPLSEKLDNYQLYGPMDCHFPKNWNGKNKYHKIFHEGKRRYAHQARLIDAGIEITKGQEIDHICANKPCFRLEHLEVVTHQENMRRAKSMGLCTGSKTSGEKHGSTKWNNAQKVDARVLRAHGVPIRTIRSKYGISRSALQKLSRSDFENAIKFVRAKSVNIFLQATVSTGKGTWVEETFSTGALPLMIVKDKNGIRRYVKNLAGHHWKPLEESKLEWIKKIHKELKNRFSEHSEKTMEVKTWYS